MTLKSAVKSSIAKNGRVWTGPARGIQIEGPDSLRVYSGLYEIELNRWIRRLVGPATAVFDIGAQYGFDALMFARLGASRVLTVEADSNLEPLLQRNIERNQMSERVTVEIGWIGDGSNDTVTIDSLAARFFVPEFIKMDIEGAEADALLGAQRVLASQPAVLIEVHAAELERRCVALLRGAGYESLVTVDPRRWLPDRRPAAFNRWVISTASTAPR
jgi:predicted nicotinamide N-methyase